jgi:hypothetical protein
MRLDRWVLGVLGGLCLVSGASAGVELITNGSFETPVVSGTFEQFPSGIPGWTGTAGIELQANGALGIGTGGTTFGNQYAELAVEAPSTYSQTVTTTPGQKYHLSFFLSDRPGTGANTVDVGFTGNTSQQFTVQDTGVVNFQSFAADFVATGTQSMLSFAPVNLQFPGGGDLIDNVSMTDAPNSGSGSAVPLPAAFWTGLSVLLALTAVGFARRALKDRPA